MSDDVGNLGAHLGVDDAVDIAMDCARERNIRKSDPLVDAEGASGKVIVECGQRTDEKVDESCVKLNDNNKMIRSCEIGKLALATYGFVIRDYASHHYADEDSKSTDFVIRKM